MQTPRASPPSASHMIAIPAYSIAASHRHQSLLKEYSRELHHPRFSEHP